MKAARNDDDDDDNLITYLVYLQMHKNTFAINTKSLTKGYHALLSSLSVLLLLLLLNKIYWIRTIFVVAVHLVLLYIYYIILCTFYFCLFVLLKMEKAPTLYFVPGDLEEKE